MKVILSRKGMDSTAEGMASPPFSQTAHCFLSQYLIKQADNRLYLPKICVTFEIPF